MKEFDLTCNKCQSQYTVEKLIPGKTPECELCDGKLESDSEVVLFCDTCNMESEPLHISLQEPILCPECNNPMRVTNQLPQSQDKSGDDISEQLDNQQETSTPTSPEIPEQSNSSQTIALASEKPPPSEQTETTEAAEIEEPAQNSNQTLAFLSDTKTEPETPGDMGKNQIPEETDEDEEIPLLTDAHKAVNKGKGNENKTAVMSPEEITEREKTFHKRGGISEETFGKYQIKHEIARGGMGIVYKVYDPDLRREMALKVLIEGEGATEETLKRFLREARAAANLRHPNIIPVHEMGEIDGQYYFTMDYIIGKSFEDVIGGEVPMSTNEFVEHMVNVCDALHVAHEQGIIHRDLKPANIMLREKGNQVVLMDFGLAKDNTSLSIQSITGSVFGSPAYMSPEQAQGMIHDIDNRSDIYSMGVLLYEGLTLEQPFKGKTVYDTMIKVVREDPVPPRKIRPIAVPKDLENIVLKCMEKEPLRRYQNIGELGDDLRAYLNGEPVSARPIPPYVRTWRRIRRKPMVLSGIIATPVVIVAFLIAWVFFSSPSYIEIAEEAIKSGDPQRQSGALSELTAQFEDGKIASDEEKSKALSLFRDCINSKDGKTCELAIAAAGKFVDPEAISRLLHTARNSKLDDKLRVSALKAIEKIGGEKKKGNSELSQDLSMIVKAKKLPENIRLEAIKAINAVRGKCCTPTLVEIAKDTDEPSKIRVAAINALGDRIIMESPAMQDILTLFGDDDEDVAAAANRALGKARTRDSILDFYGISLNKAIVGKAYEQIGKIKQLRSKYNKQLEKLSNETPGAPKPVDPVVTILKKLDDKDAAVRMAAAYDLSKLNDGRAVPALEKHLTDPNNSVRKVSAKAIVILAPKKKPNMRNIRQLLNQEDFLIREQAVYIIGALDDTDSLDNLLRLSEEETSTRVQAMLAKAYKKFGDKRSIPTLATMLKRSADKSPSTALACIKTLNTFEKDAVPYLINSIDVDNKKVQKKVIESLKEICGEDFGDDKEKWKSWFEASTP